MALTAPRALTTRQDLGLLQFGIADNVVIFPGALCAVSATGYAQPATTSLVINIAGVYTGIQDGPVSNTYGLGTADNTGTGHTAGAFNVALAQGAFSFNMGTNSDAATIANIGSIMFASDDQTVNLTDGGGTRSPAGVLVNVIGTQAIVSVNLINIRYAFTTSGAVLTTTTQTITDHKTFSAAGAPFFNNAADTFHVVLANTVTANRIWTFPDAADTFVGLTGTQELTNKTMTAMVVKTGLTASGSASNDFSTSTGAFQTPTSTTNFFKFNQRQSMAAATNLIAAATGVAIPVTSNGSLAITQNGAETNTLADPTFLGQTIDLFVDTDTSGARVVTAASRINQAANTIITMTEVGDFISLRAITIAGALKWQVVANDGCVLS